MAGTSVPQPAFTDAGFIAPAEADILSGAQADINAAFGGGLNPGLTTPQGRIASSLAVIIGFCYDEFASIVNSADPASASGRMQDAIGRIYFQTRLAAQFTTVSAQCGGLSGAAIPTGATARAADGNIYTCTSGGVIPVGGSITLQFACNVAGPITCPAGSLSQIYRTLPGWDSVTNNADGVIGTSVETRAAYELRRSQSVASNSRGSNLAVLGSVLQVPGVTDCYVTDNFTGSPVTLDGITVPAHSLYVCVVGGDPAAVANVIWQKKAPGCDYATANTSETIFDNSYPISPPSYVVKFQTAIPQNVYVLVNIANSASVPSTALAQIQAPVLAAFSGADGGTRATINQLLFASRYYAGISALGSWARIISIKLGTVLSPTAAFTATISGTTMTVSAVSSGTIALDQIVDSTAVALTPGVQISALGSGTGGTGTYTLTAAQTVSSGTSMVSTLPASDDLQIGAAHMPVLTAGAILVSLV